MNRLPVKNKQVEDWENDVAPDCHLLLTNVQTDFLWFYKNRMVVFVPSYVKRSDVAVSPVSKLILRLSRK